MLMVALVPVAVVLASGYWLWRSDPTAQEHVNVPARRTTAAAPLPAPAPSSMQPVTSATPQDPEIEALRQEIKILQQRISAIESRSK
jgi:hypothetical protein